MPQSFSRRTFLGMAAGAASATMLQLPRLKGAGQGDDYVIGVQSFSMRAFDVDTAIRHASEMGYQQIEFYKKHLDPFGTKPATMAVKKKANPHGLQLVAHGVNRFTSDHETNRKLFQFAKLVGLQSISAAPSPNSYDSLEKLVAEFNINIAIHNHGPGAEFDTLEDILSATKGRDPRIGACVDTGHYIRSGVDPIEVIERLGKRVHGVHLKDYAEAAKKAEETILGKGLLDTVDTFRALRKIDFPVNGALSVEYENNKEDPIADLKECLVVAQEAVKKTAG